MQHTNVKTISPSLQEALEFTTASIAISNQIRLAQEQLVQDQTLIWDGHTFILDKVTVAYLWAYSTSCPDTFICLDSNGHPVVIDDSKKFMECVFNTHNEALLKYHSTITKLKRSRTPAKAIGV